MAEHDLVDVARGDAGIGQRLVCHLHDQAFDGFGVEFSERRMRPSDDAGCHGWSPKIPASVDELTTKFVLDVNANNVIEGIFGGLEAELARPLRFEIARPAVDNAHDERIRRALDP